VVDRVDLLADQVVQSVGGASEQQAVSDPFDRLDAMNGKLDERVVMSSRSPSPLTSPKPR